MTRLATHTPTGPLALAKDSIPGDTAYMCRCGLSAKAPFCDGSHRATRDEAPGNVYLYSRLDGQLTRTLIPGVPVPPPTPLAPAAAPVATSRSVDVPQAAAAGGAL